MEKNVVGQIAGFWLRKRRRKRRKSRRRSRKMRRKRRPRAQRVFERTYPKLSLARATLVSNKRLRLDLECFICWFVNQEKLDRFLQEVWQLESLGQK